MSIFHVMFNPRQTAKLCLAEEVKMEKQMSKFNKHDNQIFWLSFTIKTLVIIFVFICFFIQRDIGVTFHEQFHVQAYASDGIKAVYVTNFWTGSGYTQPERNCETERCVWMNQLNELIGYNLQTLLTSIWLLFICYIFFQLVTKDDRIVLEVRPE